MTSLEIVLAVVLGLLANEAFELSPWLARKLVRWAARCQYTDPERAEARGEELTALINERPGKLLKLATAMAFAASASATSVRRRFVLWIFSPPRDHGKPAVAKGRRRPVRLVPVVAVAQTTPTNKNIAHAVDTAGPTAIDVRFLVLSSMIAVIYWTAPTLWRIIRKSKRQSVM
ncbi:hypothetical protein [Nonomuraea dietziae]|uniref:Uncharacterized protein n=1 Tax=Nonomuraea dietziae TaxID=65515 RepID=A0A7W5V5P6_9ACTN|nr:hypothetical protein [Nonomuraea dietziae]MBB3725485.1 hypothetical protein [Nonomuraea dietziae]